MLIHPKLSQLQHLDTNTYADETDVVHRLCEDLALEDAARHRIHQAATSLVTEIRSASDPGLMEVFLAEYGLSTDEGIALMCLAEALLRVPDPETMDDLIEDKIAPSDWGKHLGHSTSSLVNASTWALMLTGRVLDDERPGLAGALRGAVKRVGEPVIRSAVSRAMREMGRQFVLGVDIEKAMQRAKGMQDLGFTYSYDMLGEAARTEADARGYHLAYSRAISAIAQHCSHPSVAENPGISVKLSALHPRYEVAQSQKVIEQLVPRVRALATLAMSAGMGFNIDAEEADRLTLSLAVIEDVLREPSFANWDGFGVVVQAYGLRAGPIIDHLYDMAERLDRKIMIRLVKGAYWDTEIKRAQVEGLEGFPVFSAKPHTDISYIANAKKLLERRDRFYPQFATHNAHTVAAVLELAQTLGATPSDYEFQRLHGMGEALHKIVLKRHKTRCRIYAPVGAHEDLLAYLVRRLLENGANSSFVNQIVDETVPASAVAGDPFAEIGSVPNLRKGPDLFAPERSNSKGFDLTHVPTVRRVEDARDRFQVACWGASEAASDSHPIVNPAKPTEVVGHVRNASPSQVDAAAREAKCWDASPKARADVLRQVADLYEENAAELFALLAREAGKCLPDAVAELREAVDFLRYYAAQAEASKAAPTGLWVCISPWNFPLAIFSGQISAALAAGNAVIAKPAEQTPLIASRAISLMIDAGVPRNTLQLIAGDGSVGATLTQRDDLAGVAFTGSTETAKKIQSAMAQNARPGTPLIAETGGLNAMIVDSTALPEHAIRDIINGAFRSAGQRCSALRCLYVQEDIADDLLAMLKGAMDALTLGDPWLLSSDVGPVIDAEAQESIENHIATARRDSRVLHQISKPESGHFVSPTLIRVGSILDLKREVFGPVLHVATFRAEDLQTVIRDINATGYGLTFGLHTRIDDRVEEITTSINAGNIYVNRDQIGAVVGSQPFGGEGLSGTGPKAGGPHYLPRFCVHPRPDVQGSWDKQMDIRQGDRTASTDNPAPMRTESLPGPTGESNRLRTHPRDGVLCLGPGAEVAERQARMVSELGGHPVVASGRIDPDALTSLEDLSTVIWWGDAQSGRAYAQALARRAGPIVSLVTTAPDAAHVLQERHICIDTTAAGGNAALLAEMS